MKKFFRIHSARHRGKRARYKQREREREGEGEGEGKNKDDPRDGSECERGTLGFCVLPLPDL